MDEKAKITIPLGNCRIDKGTSPDSYPYRQICYDLEKFLGKTTSYVDFRVEHISAETYRISINAHSAQHTSPIILSGSVTGIIGDELLLREWPVPNFKLTILDATNKSVTIELSRP
jgi:hypothetical protein